MTKKEMQRLLKSWNCEIDENASYCEVANYFTEMSLEMNDDSMLYPNGRDFDADDDKWFCDYC